MEGEAMVLPVRKVEPGIYDRHPDDQPGEGGGVEDHPDDWDAHHFWKTLLPAAKHAFW